MHIHVIRSGLSDPQDQLHFRSLLRIYMTDRMGLGEHAVVSPAHIKKSLHGVIQHPMSRVYFAYLDEMCAGMAVCFEGYSTFLASPIINIHDLVVVPKLRNLGVGRAIVQYIEKEARATLVGKLTLEVRCDNPSAQDLYKGEGFRECSPAMYFWVKYLKEH